VVKDKRPATLAYGVHGVTGLEAVAVGCRFKAV
jgi:hypothetical protein